ncbi:MAG: hypothetical protein CSA95_09085 [Bacteroidetes bacterium]|nr:MAG: hypothetical protein CSA95_09085 [Bacteroidota bacterium]
MLLFFSLPLLGWSQQSMLRDTSLVENRIAYQNEYRVGVLLHSSGFGLYMRKAKRDNAFKKHFWEAGAMYHRSLKEIRTTNFNYPYSKSYVYGKLNDIFLTRLGVGGERRVASKPFYGGVAVNFNYAGGLSVVLAKPVYLYVFSFSGTPIGDEKLVLRKYDPDEHFYDNIYGRASFFSGVREIRFYPGVYARAGFDFEFGVYEPVIQSLELGLAFDLSPVPVPVMAFTDPINLFTHFYLSFSLGKRYN